MYCKHHYGCGIQFIQFLTPIDLGPIIQNSNLLISPDTAMIHVADAVGTPIVGLFSGDHRNV